ncbi:pyrroline-5-carboxylate reductase [bacterium]|nr:pyrroline-5-carboxylate reductase [bacterium]
MIKERIAFIGAGNMAEALIGGILRAGLLSPQEIIAADVREERLSYLKKELMIETAKSNEEAVRLAGTIILSVKPQVMEEVLKEIRLEAQGKRFISIAAGVTTVSIEQRLGEGIPVVRAMPNTGALIGQSATAVCIGRYTKAVDEELALKIFSAVGKVVVVKEELMDAVTGLSGSGPAYFFLAIEALAAGGVKAGLSKETALVLAAQTALGAASMVLTEGHPAILKDKVTSPGGTTIAGLTALEERGFRAALIEAVQRATQRSKELSGG